jgi:DNA (cytosine-5)-methyltransferase 1
MNGLRRPRKKHVVAGQDRNGHRIPLQVVGLFAGIGGLELGLHEAGHETQLLCEIEPTAQSVLSARFPNVPLTSDVRDLRELPKADLIVAGFPCQDLSQAGQTAGINGHKSGVVGELFRLFEDERRDPRWVLFENVPFMLQLQRGQAMEYLTERLAAAGFSWAYRIVDAQSFGLPQRRQRVLLLASRTEDPRAVLFRDDAKAPPDIQPENSPCGFYWTEGNKGLGWAVDAVPTLKGGSTIGIPSPPGIWMRQAGGEIVQPEIRDAERLQGFPPDWTAPAMAGKPRSGVRWRLVGNAVSVPMARWLGECLHDPSPYDDSRDASFVHWAPWPKAAWGMGGKRFTASVSVWPVHSDYQHLGAFLKYDPRLLSLKASSGFYTRAISSSLRFVDGFLPAVKAHVDRMSKMTE